MKAHAAGALHPRLDDDGGDVFLTLKKARKVGLSRWRFGKGHDMLTAQHGPKERVHAFLWVGDGHRAERVAVVAAQKADEAVALSMAGLPVVLNRHLHRDLHADASRIAKEGT